MTIRKRSQITIESERFWVVRGTGAVACLWCPRCGTETEMVSLQEAALVRPLPPNIRDWLETKLVHVEEAKDGSLLICLRCLAAS